MRVSLLEVTAETVDAVLALDVAPAQRRFVASNAKTIAQAHFYPKEAWFRAICVDDVPVGLIAFSLDEGKDPYLWRMMIDAAWQGKGIGAVAVELGIAAIRPLVPWAEHVQLSYVPGDGCPEPFYARLGFVPTGEVHDGELVMQRTIAAPAARGSPAA